MARKTYKKISMADIYLQSCIDCEMPASVPVYRELKGLESNDKWSDLFMKEVYGIGEDKEDEHTRTVRNGFGGFGVRRK